MIKQKQLTKTIHNILSSIRFWRMIDESKHRMVKQLKRFSEAAAKDRKGDQTSKKILKRESLRY